MEHDSLILGSDHHNSFFLGLRVRSLRGREIETKRGNDRKDDGNLLQHFLGPLGVNETPSEG